MTLRQRLLSLAAIASSLLASPAWADVACPTTPDPWDAILHIDGVPPSTNGYGHFIGMFDFFGARVLGECLYDQNNQPSLHVILDSNNNLLAGLPLTYNHLCLTSKYDITTVIDYQHEDCGVTFYPLDYQGRVFVIYGQGGDDRIQGGVGFDMIYGGKGSDDLKDYSSTTDYSLADLEGESGNDYIHGGYGDGTIMSGGTERDRLADLGGKHDIIQAGAGDDCCVYDKGGYDTLDCGPGSNDQVGNPLSGTRNCEFLTPSSYCLIDGFCQ